MGLGNGSVMVLVYLNSRPRLQNENSQLIIDPLNALLDPTSTQFSPWTHLFTLHCHSECLLSSQIDTNLSKSDKTAGHQRKSRRCLPEKISEREWFLHNMYAIT